MEISACILIHYILKNLKHTPAANFKLQSLPCLYIRLFLKNRAAEDKSAAKLNGDICLYFDTLYFEKP
jgi:hypothetical protein